MNLTEYSLESDGSGEDSHLLAWSVEGSNDGILWDLLDWNETRDLDGDWITKSYLCDRRNDKCFRYLRLRRRRKMPWQEYSHSKDESDDWDCLMLSQIEFFGTLYRGRVQVT